MNKYIITAFLLCVISFPVWSQNDGDDVRDVRRGNRDFKKENYREADIDYRKALVKDSTSVAANYNLANTLYRQGDMEQARKMLDRVKETAPATEAAADYYYNLGDVAIAQQDWQTAVDALEQSLLRNPGDLQAKENYIYARKKLQEQQNQQQNNQDQQNDQNDQNDQNQDKQDNKDDQQNQDKNDDQNKNDDDRQDQKNDRQDNQDQNNDQQQDQQKPQQSQGEQPKISPQAAQQMLQAIQAKEKETQDKVNKEKAAALKARQKDKNW